MKTSKLFLTLSAIICFILFSSETLDILDSNGKLANAGSPGEFTCSSAGCHGSGSAGGLANNAGPGSVTLTSSPAFVGNTYVPGQVYSITIVVSETGKSLFGFSCECVDNTGSTNTAVNNAVGLITITNSLTTRKGQPFGTGRLCVTHQPNGGAVANTASFSFNWTAPASGTVNVYYDATAVNSNSLADGADNVYAHNFKLTVYVAPPPNSIVENSLISDVKIFPIPAKNNLTISFNSTTDSPITASIVDLSGKNIIKLFSKNVSSGNYKETIDVSELPNGLYFLILKGNDFTKTEKIIIAN